MTPKLVVGQELPSELIDRAKRSDSSGPFGRAVWWDSWWRHLRPPGSELFLLTISRGDQLLGIAPWYTQRTWSFGRIVRFLGDGRACSDYMTIAATPGHRDDVWREITRWVGSEAGKSWDTFILVGRFRPRRTCAGILRTGPSRGLLVDQRTVGNTWRVSLPETWEAYVELFSKQHRNRLRRTKREMWDSGRAVLHRVTNLRDFERGFTIQHRLHQERRHEPGRRRLFRRSTIRGVSPRGESTPLGTRQVAAAMD